MARAPARIGSQAQATTKSEGTQAINRCLSVMKSFIQDSPELGITEIANRLSLSPSTVHRIVRALAANDFLEQNEHTDRYYLGKITMILGQVAQHNFGIDRALPILEKVAAETGESVNLGIRDGDAAIVMLRIESQHPLRFDQPPGTRVPLYSSAMGKSLLAFSEDPESEVARLKVLRPLTPKTTTDLDELLIELRRTKKRGYSLDNEESIEGASCVGAPVVGLGGVARAAIAIQAPSVRMTGKRRRELGPLLAEAASQISQLIPPERNL